MIRKLLLSIVVCFFGIGNLYAGDILEAQVSEYSVTIIDISIFNSTLGTWHVVSSTSATVNIASAGAGAEVGSMVGSPVLPNGTYTSAKANVSGSIGIKACWTSDTARCTDGTTTTAAGQTLVDVTAGGSSLAAATTGTSVIDFSLITLPSGATATAAGVEIIYSLSSPIIVGPSQPQQIVVISFDVDNVLTENAGLSGILPDFPGVTLEVN